ncbi:MAG: ATP-grasp domain-containing protein [Gemmatimonadales bacterium]
MARITLATAAHIPELAPDDQLLLPVLRALGAEVEPAVWSDAAYPWAERDLVVVRSTWDYEGQRAAFVGWAREVSRVTRIENDADLLDWNTDKSYLERFGREGLPVVATAILDGAGPGDLELLLAERGWDEAVVKPAVGAGGRDIYRVRAGRMRDAGDGLNRMLGHGRALVQPFLRTVEAMGELSLLFFDGRFSHAAIKRPATGEFRVQEVLGGSTTRIDVTAREVAAGERVLAALTTVPLYARCDFLHAPDGEWLLSELELTEPSMFMVLDPAAPERFARAILSRAGTPAR